MSLAASDRELVAAELGRAPTDVEASLFENLWSEHCAYRSSRPVLASFESEGDQVVIGPGDDAAVVRITDDLYAVLGIESHNHPSFVDPYDGAATGVGGIVRDVLSMGAYPIALTDCLFFGPFEEEHSRYLLDGVVEGIADYGNAIGVPTVAGSVDFHPGYAGNPLVNVGCVGVLHPDRLVTAAATTPGNRLVLVGSATGRDGLGGASFASEDLAEDAETEDRPAVQVGDPYTEKLLIEANEALLDEELVEAARDLGAAGLGGATSEMVGKADLGATIELDQVHQREPGMTPLEILLSESQERMCYEVRPADLARVEAIAERYDLGFSVVGTVTTGNYVCTYRGETVVDVPAPLVTEGAPVYQRTRASPPAPTRDRPTFDLEAAFEAVVSSPSTASKAWVYRQYDHEVGVRTARPPGGNAAVLALREAECGLAITAGSNPRWTAAAPRDGARGVALEAATNLAVVGARPLAAVDCLNAGNPEKPAVFGGFANIVDGLAAMCRSLSVPVVGGNVSLYNDSATGPVPPTPTLMMVGVREGYTTPPSTLVGDGTLVLVGKQEGPLGGSVYLDAMGGSDRFPSLPDDPLARIEQLAAVADRASTLSVHDLSHGGLAVGLAEMVAGAEGAGVEVDLSGGPPAERLFGERPGRALVETTAPEELVEAFSGVAPVTVIGHTTDAGLSIETDAGRAAYTPERLRDLRVGWARKMD